MNKIDHFLNRMSYQSTTPDIFMKMRLVLECHKKGFSIVHNSLGDLSDSELEEWDVCFQHTINCLQCV